MISFTPIRPFVRYVARQSGPRQRGMPQSTSCFHLSLGCVKQNYDVKPNSCQSLTGPDVAKQQSYWQSLTMKSVVRSRHGRQKSRLDISLGPNNMNLRLLFPKHGLITRMKWSLAPLSWASAGLVLGLSVYDSASEPAYAEARPSTGGDCNSSTGNLSHGKQVHTDYSVIGIPGDGRCLFRAVAHGACIRSGKPAPSESHQRELADELRARVADEFVKRREETEWFIEGNFDKYVSQIRKTHVWGGEPELLMASHVLKMPITVYMKDEDCGGLISIAEYGEEYGKKDPIRVLYHGFGHYDALHIPRNNDSRSRL